MTTETTRYMIVIEKGASSNRPGVTIDVSEPLPLVDAEALLLDVVRGRAPQLYKPTEKGVVLKVTERQYVDVTTARLTPTTHSRITLAEVVA
jgi:hypothetical protein